MANSNLKSGFSSLNEFKRAACYQIFTALCMAPLFGGDYFLPLYLIVYIDFLINSRNHPKDTLSKQCLVGFAISITVSVFYAIYHYEALSNGSGDAKYTLIGLGWFAAGFMVIDSARFQFSFYKLDKRVLAIILILTTTASIVFLVGRKIIEEPGVIDRALTFSDRYVYWSGLNPNHVDNVVMYTILLLIWSVSNYSKSRLSILAVAFMNFLFMMFMFYISGSRGGILGVFTSALIIGIIYFARQNKKAHLLYLAVILGIVGTAGILTSSRITQGINSISELVVNVPSTEKLFANSSLGSQKNRSAILEILNEPSSENEKPVTVRVAQICWPSGTLNQDEAFKGLDQNTVFRYLMFWESIKVWLEEPYFGHGYYDKSDIITNYENTEPCIIGYFTHLHNHYMNILIYYGAVGLIIFTLLMLYSLYMFDRMCRLSGNKLLYIPTFYFLYLIVENNFDLTFDRNSDLLAVLFCVLMLFSITASDGNSTKVSTE